MKKNILAFTILISMLVTACNESPKKTNIENNTNTSDSTSNELIKNISTDKDGKILEMTFDNKKDIATLNFNGETIELIGQKPASGIWYKNDNYELRGKGENVELTKNGKIIFKTEDSNISLKETDSDVQMWWVGKYFINNRTVNKNPEEGGADFLKINKNQTAEYKVGDIVEDMTWKSNNSSITFKNKLTERQLVFKIEKSFLTDEFGTKWTIKQ